MSSSALEINSNLSRTTAATRFVTLKGDYGTGDFIMHRGGVLKEVVIAYEAFVMGFWKPLSNIFRLKKPQGLRRLVYFWQGFFHY